MQTSYQKIRVSFIAPPFSGHLYPILELAQLLMQDSAYEVRIYTGENKIRVVQELGLEGIPLQFESENVLEQIADTAKPVKSNPLRMLDQLKQNVALFPAIIKQLETHFSADQPDIVITDFTAVPAGILCDQLEIPWITVIPTPFAIENTQGTPSYLGGWRPHEGKFYAIRDRLGCWLIHSVKRMLFQLIRKEAKQYSFHLYSQKGEESIYSPYSILGLGMKELEFPRDYPQQFQMIGPCCQTPDRDGAPLVMDDFYRKKVFVTLGTHLKWGKKKMIELLSELALDFTDYLFVFSLGDEEDTEKRLDQLPENLWIRSFVSYTGYIALFDFVIHHGGAGITYHCIKNGLPALAVPHDYDQFDYAARIEYHQAGISYGKRKLTGRRFRSLFSQLSERQSWPGLQDLKLRSEHYQPGERLKETIHAIKNRKG